MPITDLQLATIAPFTVRLPAPGSRLTRRIQRAFYLVDVLAARA